MRFRFELVLFVFLFLIDLVFHLVGFDNITTSNLLWMVMVDAGLTLLFSFLVSKRKSKTQRYLAFIFLLIFGIYAYAQLEIRNILNAYYSFQLIADGGFRVQSFVWYFISHALWTYYLPILLAFIFLLLTHYIKLVNKSNSINLPFSALSFICFFMALSSATTPLKDALINQDNFELIIRNTSINSFLLEDISSVFIPRSKPTLLIEEEITEQEKEKEVIQTVSIDDSEWKKVMEAEENETFKTIDTYLSNRPIPQPNEMTGRYEGYNFIYFLVESFDYIGVDPELTPTLYKMMSEGYQFPNHYTPIFSCGTGDSEFVAMTSMMPYGASCTVYSVINHNLTNSLGGLFSRAGYPTYSYHNWNDEFYDRTTLHRSFGLDMYEDIDDLNIQLVHGWQSDDVMIQNSIDEFINEDKFFTFYVTSTMHWPYDQHSYYGDAYLNEINEVHPEYPIEVKRFMSKTIEFDHSLKTLVDALEAHGKLDNTVICFWADHHPFNLDINYIQQYSNLMDRSGIHGLHKSPLILYCASDKGFEVEDVNSTFDHLPTIANLFNLNYDPRLYMGSDVFNHDTKVIFPNGDWIVNEGTFINSLQTFEPFPNKQLDPTIVKTKDKEISNLIRVGRAMVDVDYFSQRKFLLDPKKIISEVEVEEE